MARRKSGCRKRQKSRPWRKREREDEERTCDLASRCDAWSAGDRLGGLYGGRCLATSASPPGQWKMKGETIEGSRGERRHREIIIPSRRRTNEGSFAYIPHRFLRAGFWQSCSPQELCLYMFLVMVSDQDGTSYYGHQKLRMLCKLDEQGLECALTGLEQKDLIARRGTLVQVLSLPDKPLVRREPLQGAVKGAAGEPVPVGEELRAFVARLERSRG